MAFGDDHDFSKVDSVLEFFEIPDTALSIECPKCEEIVGVFEYEHIIVYCEDCHDEHPALVCPHCKATLYDYRYSRKLTYF